MPQAIPMSSATTTADAPGLSPRRRGVLRALLGVGAALTLPGVALTPAPGFATYANPPMPPPRSEAGVADVAEWSSFRDRFITPEGRVVDSGGVSHSEGQGYAMLIAGWAGDRATFERVLAWTRTNLSRPHDALFTWRFRVGEPLATRDRNSATDGDLMIAWALQRAGERWAVPDWGQLAAAIARDVLRLSVRNIAGRTVLLPGPQGFEKWDRVILNPSYYCLPALRALAQVAPNPAWAELEKDAHWLLDAARFGDWTLSADWVELIQGSGAVVPAAAWPQRFSWDAVRVPLFLAWAGQHAAPALASAVAFWTRPRPGVRPGVFPAWTDLRSGAPAPYAAHAGIVAVASVCTAAHRGDLRTAVIPRQAEATDYYGGALIMLARMARQESLAAQADPPLVIAAR